MALWEKIARRYKGRLAVWGYETFGSRNFVEAHISRLRRKLSRAGTVGAIKTVRGVGYVIR